MATNMTNFPSIPVKEAATQTSWRSVLEADKAAWRGVAGTDPEKAR